MSRCPVLAACLVAGYDPSRVVERDFSRPPKYIAPVRKPQRPPANPRERKQYLWEGVCVPCGKAFSRMVNLDAREPETCSVACAAQLRWTRSGHRSFGKHNRDFNRTPFRGQP